MGKDCAWCIQAELLGQFSVKSNIAVFFFYYTGQLDTLQVYKLSDTVWYTDVLILHFLCVPKGVVLQHSALVSWAIASQRLAFTSSCKSWPHVCNFYCPFPLNLGSNIKKKIKKKSKYTFWFEPYRATQVQCTAGFTEMSQRIMKQTEM